MSFSYPNAEEDIFVIDCWIDTESKENDLISLIKILKEFKFPILLAGHYPVRPEIQKMVDYYIFDKDNPILLEKEFALHDVGSGRWTKMDNYLIQNKLDFHHDYAIWTTMRNAFYFAKYLNKKYIHFLEYDNLPDPIQYRQAFLEYSRKYDAIIYEYDKGSAFSNNSEFCATFIFTIQTDIAIQLIDKIKSRAEYFYGRTGGWQLEKLFLQYLKSVTNRIYISKYIANNSELNTQAVWERDGILRNGEKFQIYLAADHNRKLYAHFISGFSEYSANKDYLVEIVYGNFKKFHLIKKEEMSTIEIGEYRRGDRVKVYYLGVEVYNEFLGLQFEAFREKNKLTFDNPDNVKLPSSKKTVNINFIDGPFFEILEETENEYFLNFINNSTAESEYGIPIKSNHWAKSSKQYFVDWRIKINGKDFENEYQYNANGKRVLIGFESKSIGDTIAWFPYVDEFRKKHNCNVICSTFHNYLFKEQYPEIEFVAPGTNVHNLYALYRIGIFNNNENTTYDEIKHPIDPRKIPLQKVSSDILGIEYKEIVPKLKNFNLPKKKKVCFGIHSTTQAKYWNHPEGWQKLYDFLVDKGYEVLLLSREEDGYMGNYHPQKIPQLKPSSLEVIMQHLQESRLFIGTSSGLSWLSWACGTPTIIISGFTDDILEPQSVHRIINKNACHGCWSDNILDPGDWNWCPRLKNTDRIFECTKTITPEIVIDKVKTVLGIQENKFI